MINEFLNDLPEDDLDAAPMKRTPAVQHPCGQCGGSGKWSGGYNRNGESKCFACKGQGYFKTSAHDRQKARASRQASKAKKLVNAQEAFEIANPGLMGELIAIMDWNSFAASMVAAFRQYGSLTEKQLAASKRMLDKIAANKAKRDEERKAAEVTVDLSPIREMFETATGNGLKRPKYRAEGLEISLASPNGRNADFLYVKTTDGDYQGKISPDHTFSPFRAQPETFEALKVIAENPSEAAVRFGKMTGSCGCCGRTLTNPASIEAGIGPICADKWGF